MLGPLLAPTSTVLPITEFTLPAMRTFGASGGVDVADADCDVESGEEAESDFSELLQAATNRTVAERATK